MASMGKGQDKLVAVDNVIIKMSSNKSRNATFNSEPEKDIKFKVIEQNLNMQFTLNKTGLLPVPRPVTFKYFTQKVVSVSKCFLSFLRKKHHFLVISHYVSKAE